MDERPAGARFIGCDFAAGDDWTVEVEASKAPDGKLVIHDLRRWRHTIEGSARRVDGEGGEDG